MLRPSSTIATLVITFAFVSHASAQFYSQGTGGGIAVGAFLGNTEVDTKFSNERASLQVRTYLRHRIFDHLQGELGLGLGQIEGKVYAYRTQMMPVDYRLLWSPLSSYTWTPYVYAGAGALYVDVKQRPVSQGVTLYKQWRGWTGYLPGGIGMMFRLNDNTSLDVSGGYNYTFIDSLNSIKSSTGRKDRFWSFSVGLATSGMSSEADPDNDGLSNKFEEQIGTDPHNPDTDHDGLTDGEEVNQYHTDPLKADSDGDGLSDGDEVHVYHTDPNATDTDGDGLSDGDEVMKYHTDPLKTDTDGDGLSDGDEVHKYHTDPLKKDTDGDGLTDGEEVLKYHTDPLNPDTDGDGLSDGDEVLKYHTDPLKKDTDGDGLTDGEEILRYHTDPLNIDTDGGTVDDGTEVRRGTDPLNPADDIPKKPTFSVDVGQKIVLEGVVFKSGKAEITPESQVILEKAFNTLQAFPEIQVEIQGHTDDVGKPQKNLKLSQARADAVKAYLVRKGITPDRIATKGYGSERALVPNTTSEGRTTNRRIEFVRIK